MRKQTWTWIVIAIAGLAVVNSPDRASAAATSYLRPNSDVQLDGWSVVGATTAWDALNDSITEAQTPTTVDYVKKPSRQGHLVVNLDTYSLKGQKILAVTGWFYTPTSTAVTFGVADGVTEVASATFSSAGWHSVSVPLTSQAQLDNATFRFKSESSGEHQIPAAFLKLVVDDSPKVYWGSWIDGEVYGSTEDAPWNLGVWNMFEEHASKPVSIVHFGQRPPWEGQPFDEVLMNKVTSRGAIPLVDMANDFPWFTNHVSLKAITEGAVDAPFASWATEVKNYGKPFFLRWDWEMNGNWFLWSKEMATSYNGLYVDAWRHLYNVAKAAGAENITWVWCPNVSFSGELLNFNQLYPGNSYVDWTCMDGYNRGTNPISPEGWLSFGQRFGATYESLLSRAPEKPIMIGELASTEEGGSKAAWLTDALLTQLPLNFPNVKALVWFNWNIKAESGLRWDWPIESTPSAQTAFANGISSPYYASNTFGSLPPLTKVQPLP